MSCGGCCNVAPAAQRLVEWPELKLAGHPGRACIAMRYWPYLALRLKHVFPPHNLKWHVPPLRQCHDVPHFGGPAAQPGLRVAAVVQRVCTAVHGWMHACIHANIRHSGPAEARAVMLGRCHRRSCTCSALCRHPFPTALTSCSVCCRMERRPSQCRRLRQAQRHSTQSS